MSYEKKKKFFETQNQNIFYGVLEHISKLFIFVNNNRKLFNSN